MTDKEKIEFDGINLIHWNKFFGWTLELQKLVYEHSQHLYDSAPESRDGNSMLSLPFVGDDGKEHLIPLSIIDNPELLRENGCYGRFLIMLYGDPIAGVTSLNIIKRMLELEWFPPIALVSPRFQSNFNDFANRLVKEGKKLPPKLYISMNITKLTKGKILHNLRAAPELSNDFDWALEYSRQRDELLALSDAIKRHQMAMWIKRAVANHYENRLPRIKRLKQDADVD